MAEQAFHLKRKYILGLGVWLQGLSLYGRESRERTKFVEQVADEIKENEEMRKSVVEKYADKNEDGTPKLEGEGDKKQYVITPEKMAEFTKEMNEYLEEEWVLPIDGNKERLKKIKFIVVDTNEKIDPKIANEYDKWCEALEALPE